MYVLNANPERSYLQIFESGLVKIYYSNQYQNEQKSEGGVAV